MSYTITDRVKDLIKDRYGENPNYKRISTLLGMKYTTLIDMINKDYESWQSKYLILISDHFKVTTDYLLGLSETVTPNIRNSEKSKLTSIPIYGNVWCGSPAPQWDVGEVKHYIELPDLMKYKYSFGVIAKGDSMIPYINPNDYLICVDKQELIKDGKAVIVVFKGTHDNNEVNAKLIKIDRERSLVTLYSVNTKHHPQVYNEEEILKIYKLIRIIREVK